MEEQIECMQQKRKMDYYENAHSTTETIILCKPIIEDAFSYSTLKAVESLLSVSEKEMQPRKNKYIEFLTQYPNYDALIKSVSCHVTKELLLQLFCNLLKITNYSGDFLNYYKLLFDPELLSTDISIEMYILLAGEGILNESCFNEKQIKAFAKGTYMQKNSFVI